MVRCGVGQVEVECGGREWFVVELVWSKWSGEGGNGVEWVLVEVECGEELELV